MTFLIKCPWCNIDIEVVEMNCKIFRCGIYKSNNKQVPPHSKKVLCDKIVIEGLIWGCAKPFHINNPDGNPVKCGYI